MEKIGQVDDTMAPAKRSLKLDLFGVEKGDR